MAKADLLPGIDVKETDTEALAAELAALARPKNTRRAYDYAWADFERFCDRITARPLPARPSTVARYLADCQERGLSISALEQRRGAIRDRHLARKIVDPNKDPYVHQVWTGILMTSQREIKKKQAIMEPGLRTLLDAIDDEVKKAGIMADLSLRLQAFRDKALFLLMFKGKMLPAELSTLMRDQIKSADYGFMLTGVNRSDIPKKGRDVELRFSPRSPLCPARALQEWLRITEMGDESYEGPIFQGIDINGSLRGTALTTNAIWKIFQRRCASAGLDTKLCSVRSIRSGGMHQDAFNGKTDDEIIRGAGLAPITKPLHAKSLASARKLGKSQTVPPPVLKI